MSECLGIFQSDLIIETAIREGWRDFKANPWLHNYVFRSLLDDDLTKKHYGQKFVDTAKNWLLKTEIPIFINTRLDDSRCPAITINLIESVEVDNTLGDVHADPTEPLTDAWEPLAGPFTPVSWDSDLGTLTLPDAVPTASYVFPGMNILDRNGVLHEILDVQTNDDGQTVAYVAEGTIADFSNSYLKSASPPQVLELESGTYRESFLIGCHTNGEPWQLVVLHSAMVFILMRYRQSLLEARGFGVSAISSTDFSKNQAYDPEQVYSRYISLNGKVQQIVPKAKRDTVQGVVTSLKIIGGENLPPDTDPDESSWMGDEDSLTVGLKR